jgi:two-component system, OmpR family, phosphate regulon sensor histidine kinase PhoR
MATKALVGTGLAAALAAGLLLALLGENLAETLAAATLSGAAAAVFQHVWLSRFRREIALLTQHVRDLSASDAPPTNSRTPDPCVAPLVEAVELSVASLRKTSDETARAKRDLSLQLRVCEAELRNSEAILNSIADAVIVTDAFNDVVLANDAAARVLGFSLSDSTRKPVEQVVRDGVLSKLIKDTRDGGESTLRRHVEHRLPRAGEQAVFDVSLSCFATARSGREPAGVVTILRDITKEKAISEMKSDFVSNVSHELRTPLSSIKAYVEMLVDGEAGDEQTRAEFYNIIQGETNRLQRLIDNVLNISRIESGVVRVQREHVKLNRLVHDAVEVMQPQARAKGIELVEAPTPTRAQVLADKDMLYQVVLNLVGNAIKYTKDRGKVRVSIAVDEQAKTVAVAVTDSGVGIPEEDIPHVFDKFYRVADHKKLAKGTGLGLALVRQIIETVHAGKLELRSTVGKGSTFTFHLPLADNG